MNTDSLQLRKTDRLERVGDFTFDEEREYIFVWLPGTTGPDAIRISRAKSKEAWLWDGNEDQPTLSPSLLARGQWHGFMRSGRLESC